MKRIIKLLTIVVSVVLLCACDTKEPVVGKWTCISANGTTINDSSWLVLKMNNDSSFVMTFSSGEVFEGKWAVNDDIEMEKGTAYYILTSGNATLGSLIYSSKKKPEYAMFILVDMSAYFEFEK